MEERVQKQTRQITQQQMFDDGWTTARVEDVENEATTGANPEDKHPTTPTNSRPEGLLVDPDLLSPYLDRLAIDPQGEESSDNFLPLSPTLPIRQQVQINQKHANERSKRQYGKQRHIITFEIGDQVSVAVLALDRAVTDDKRIFGRVIDVNEDYDSYKIITKYGVLDRNYPISELNPLPRHIDIGISNPPPTAQVTLHYCAAQESTVEKVPVHCNCRDQKTWCSTRRCACVKAEVKCSIACHGGTNQDNTPDCPNISSMAMRTQKGHRTRDQTQDQIRDQELEAKEAKRLRRNTAGQWVASKGVDTSESSSKGKGKGKGPKK